MKKLLTTRDAELMANLHLFLTQQGIPITVSERGDQLELWVTQTSYYALAKQEVDRFKADPASAQLNTEQATPVRQQSFGGASLRHNLMRNAGPITMTIAVLVVAVYLLLQTQLAEQVFATLRIGDYFNTLPSTQIWRYVSPMLLHFSAMHFVFNLFWWWYLAGRMERSYGSVILLLVTLICSVIANVAQLYSTGPFFGGLSGVVYGLFGFAAVLSYGKPRHPLYLPPALLVFMVAWLLLGYTDLLWVKVANEAHLAGLLGGLLCAVLTKLYSRFSGKYTW